MSDWRQKKKERERKREGPPGHSSSAAGDGVRRADEHVTLTKTGLPAIIGNESPLGRESDPGHADRKSPSGKQSDPGYADRNLLSGKQSDPGYADRNSPSGKQSDPGYADRKSPSGIHRAAVPNLTSGIGQALVPQSPSGNLQPSGRQNNAPLHDPRNLYQGDIDDYEVIVIPIHIPSGNAGHWVLGIFDINVKEISFL
uniref:Ubiquitin-like protease family profile domain-containing protein n=1 Tax=Ditylenchus dipsaci TaxID=166011 RepID=A0A915EPA5_9BILA